jgi:hypothetical protein
MLILLNFEPLHVKVTPSSKDHFWPTYHVFTPLTLLIVIFIYLNKICRSVINSFSYVSFCLAIPYLHAYLPVATYHIMTLGDLWDSITK